eukprot:TRINITY_DN130_c1_g1_i3.p1 TRINITY_DN130_c1_g1~~TRINITY_DN130_c1_g1_i3.p1  ORF type:complete len:1378 (+),score=218.26 TRINITY_DN130_c1_g1_i3:2452-6585(+)
MEVIASVDTFVGLYTTIFDRLKAIRTRLERFRNHPKDVEELQQLAEQLSTDVDELRGTPSISTAANVGEHLKLVEHHLREAFSILGDIGTTFSASARDKPNSQSEERRSRLQSASKNVRRLTRTTRTEENLASAKFHLQLAKDELDRILLKRTHEDVHQNSAALQRIERRLNHLRHVKRDCFRASTRVTPNPENLVLDFDSRDEIGIPVTYEGKVKQAILGPESPPLVMVTDGKVTGATGGGGMGKSCAVRALGSVQEIRETFVDGLYEISLGMNATTSKLIEEICECIEASGGELLCETLSTETNVFKVLRRAGQWFRERKVLFVVDDVWENHQITTDIVLALKWLLGTNESRMVFTSRGSQMWECAGADHVIEFETRGVFSKQSRAMLLKNAGINEESEVVQGNEERLMGLLEICGGLPVALAIAGQLVRKTRWRTDPFGDLLFRLKNRPEMIRERKAAGYGALSKLLDETVKHVESHNKEDFVRDLEMSVEDMMQSFCVMEKQEFAPVSMLRRLWGVHEELEARDVMEALCDVGLVKQVVKRSKRREEIGLRLHDLVHEHFACKANGKKKELHRRLLHNYVSIVSADGEGEACREWWNVNEEQDLYIYHNVLRHLIAGDMVMEAVQLVLDPRWTVKQIRAGGIRQAVEDYTIVLEALPKKDAGPNIEGKIEASSVAEAMELIREAVLLSVPYVLNNEREIWFQLYGRLVGSIDKKSTHEYLGKVKKYAEKPWVRCRDAFLKQAGGLVERSLSTDGWWLKSASFGKNGSLIIAQTNKHRGTSCNILRFGKGDESEGTIIWSMVRDDTVVNCEISDDGNTVVLFAFGFRDLLDDGIIRACLIFNIVDVQRRVMNSMIAVDYGKEACMKLSASGGTLIFADNDGTVNVCELEGTSLQQVSRLEHDSVINCAAVSADGKRVAVAMGNGFEQVVEWEAESEMKRRVFSASGEVEDVAYSHTGCLAFFSSCVHDARREFLLYNVSVFDGDNKSVTPTVTIDVFGVGFKDLGSDLQWSPDGRYILLTRILLDVSEAPRKIRCAELPDDTEVARGLSSDGRLVVMRRSMVIEVIRIGSLHWHKVERSAERHFVMDVRDLRRKLKKLGQKARKAKWNTEGSLIATTPSYIREETASVCVWDANGNLYTALERDIDSDVDLAWAGQTLAVVQPSCVQLWDVQQQRLVQTLRCSQVDASDDLDSIDVSDDAFTVVASTYRWRRIWVWQQRNSRWQLARIVRTVGHPFCVASSSSGRFTACETHRGNEPGVVVHDEHGRRCQGLTHRRVVKRLWFDEEDNVVIEWYMVDKDDRVQFSAWRWRESATAEPLERTTPYVKKGRFLHGGNHQRLATFEFDADYDYDYNARANALVVIAKDVPHVLHIET